MATEATCLSTGETEMPVSGFDAHVPGDRKGRTYISGETETAVSSSGEDAWEELAWNVRELAALYDNHNWHPQFVERTETGQISAEGMAGASRAPARGAPTNHG